MTLERLSRSLHLVVALGAVWLFASSPWLALYGRLADAPTLVNQAHVAVGLLVLAAALPYAWSCTAGGRWRLYFPWLAGQWRPLADDVTGLARGRRPMSEGGGLLATLEGLLLAVLVALALTGLAWWLTQGTDAAYAWRAVHGPLARAGLVLLAAHVVGVALHLVDLMRG